MSRTSVRLAFDEDHLFVRFEVSQTGGVRVQNLLRDFNESQNDFVGFAIDGFLDQRNAMVFMATPFGSKRDLIVSDGDVSSEDWNGLWEVAINRSDRSWTAEFSIPWRTLRYPSGTSELGILFFRADRSRNEIQTWPAMPRSVPLHRVAYAARVIGLDPPTRSPGVQIRPYGLAEARTDDGTRSFRTGTDLKWQASSATVVDLTLNTDFAQADIDRLAVTFDRYPILFPEKRPFFLENATLFNASVTSFIQPFFSRRVGLDAAGTPLQIRGGMRLTHADARNNAGMLLIDQEGSRVAVGRYSRSFPDEARLGVMGTYLDGGAASNATATVDGQVRPTATTLIRGMVSGSTDQSAGDGWASQAWFSYRSNLLYAGMLTYAVSNYRPALGVERFGRDYVMLSPAFYFDLTRHPFPSWVRRYRPGAYAFSFIEPDLRSNITTYIGITPIDLILNNGGAIAFTWIPTWQQLDAPFSPLGVRFEPGRYRYDRFRANASSDPSAAASVYGSVEDGTYYDGRLRNLTLGTRLAASHRIQWTLEASHNQLNDVDATLLDSGLRLAWSPEWLGSVFGQWDSRTERVIWSGRLSWEYRPLSFIHLVYNGNRINDITQQQVIFKIALLHAF